MAEEKLPNKARLIIPGFGYSTVNYNGGMFYHLRIGKYTFVFAANRIDQNSGTIIMFLEEIKNES